MLDIGEFVHLQKYIQEYLKRDGGTHVFRVGRYTSILLKELGFSQEHSDYVGMAASLHDIGKLFIDPDILENPGKLTDEEFEVVKTHTTKGFELLKDMKSHFFQIASDIALYHHENFNGSGYPFGLKGDQIPFNAQVASIVDVFDSLAHPRVYKEAWSISKTIDFIHEQKGIKFDPKIVDAFDKTVNVMATLVMDDTVYHHDWSTESDSN